MRRDARKIHMNPAGILNLKARTRMSPGTNITANTASGTGITLDRPRHAPSTRTVWLLFAAIFIAVYFASLFSPPLLDDVDAAHAQAAQDMAETGDLITSKIDGIRYIEKPPLPYWMVAGMYKIFGQNTFATHLPNALAMLGADVARVAVGAAGVGRRARALCRAGRADVGRAVSVYAIHHSRVDSGASFCCLRSMR